MRIVFVCKPMCHQYDAVFETIHKPDVNPPLARSIEDNVEGFALPYFFSFRITSLHQHKHVRGFSSLVCLFRHQELPISPLVMAPSHVPHQNDYCTNELASVINILCNIWRGLGCQVANIQLNRRSCGRGNFTENFHANIRKRMSDIADSLSGDTQMTRKSREVRTVKRFTMESQLPYIRNCTSMALALRLCSRACDVASL
eukprot:9455687-Pyramimonas_sp.AAC.2